MTIFRWKDEGCGLQYTNSWLGFWTKGEIESELIARGHATNPTVVSYSTAP